MTDYETLSITQAEPDIFLFRMNRPASANALNTQMGLDLVSAFEAVLMDPQPYRCIILTGAGDKAFCAGGDLKERNGMTDAAWRAQHLIFERMARAIIACPVPVIAAVNGSAYGGGCEIAAACDFILASENAMFALPETKLGIIPGAGGTQRLPRAVGKAKAMDLALTGRMMDATEAERAGLVSRVVPLEKLMDEALGAALQIADFSQIAVMAAKESVNRAFEGSLADGVMFERRLFHALFATADQKEGMDAFVGKRKAQFKHQ